MKRSADVRHVHDLESRAIVEGIRINDKAKAYPLTTLQKQSPIIDTVCGVPLFIIGRADNRSVRAFEITVDGQKLELFLKPETSQQQSIDKQSDSRLINKCNGSPLVDKGKASPAVEKKPSIELIDKETGSLWDFSGRATSGPLSGRQLNKISVLEDYWLDWNLHNTNTTVYVFGAK